MSLKLPVYLGGLSAFETTETNGTKAVSLQECLAFYLLSGVVVRLLQSHDKQHGTLMESEAAAGVSPAHVHCFA